MEIDYVGVVKTMHAKAGNTAKHLNVKIGVQTSGNTELYDIK